MLCENIRYSKVQTRKQIEQQLVGKKIFRVVRCWSQQSSLGIQLETYSSHLNVILLISFCDH